MRKIDVLYFAHIAVLTVLIVFAPRNGTTKITIMKTDGQMKNYSTED